MEIRFDTYCDNAALGAMLDHWIEAHPSLVERRVLGRSFEGAEIPLCVVTNRDTGPDTDKPAFWVDGNIHATEVTASMAALYLIDHLLRGHGSDPEITRVVDEQVFYVVPRLNPDGAARALARPPEILRSGTRPYPEDRRADGLHVEDVDGDGRVLQMRIRDAAGDWKVSDRDPRLLVKRAPHENGGTYYRVLPEGRVESYDGYTIEMARAHRGLDFNRNFPAGWRPEGEQLGAGDFPGSEPEIRAVIDFMTTHPNVFGAITFHTYGRVLLRPFSDRSDEQMDTHDLWVFDAIGELGTELTEYPCVSVFHHFRYHPKETMGGAFDDWLYDHLGAFALTVELWDLPTASGIETKRKDLKFIEWSRTHPVEDDHRILSFVTEHAPDALVEWRPFEHPELGPVEIGGWDFLFSWRNPPPALLESEIARQAPFVVGMASMAPRLRWVDVRVTPVGTDRWHVLAVVENVGYLPTSGSQRARKTSRAEPVRVELVSDAAEFERGRPRQTLGHLEGRSNKTDRSSGRSVTDNRGSAEWIVRAPEGASVELMVTSSRAGRLRRAVTLVARDAAATT